MNDRNASSVFAAGRTSSGSFISHWDGAQWSTIGTFFVLLVYETLTLHKIDLPLSATSDITQLEMVPLQEDHDSTSLIESNRMLWISGSLQGSNFTQASSALYDGQNLYPYLVTSTASGDAGSISSFFHSFSTFSFTSRSESTPLVLVSRSDLSLAEFLAVSVVILISIAIGAGIVFLIGLIGILWTLFARRDDRNFGQDTIVEDDDSVRPSSLLAHVNAAARNTILGTPKNDYYGHKGEETVVDDRLPIAGAAAAAEQNALTPVTTDEHDVNRPAQARYSFDGSGEGELKLTSGQQVIVLNDQDPAYVHIFIERCHRQLTPFFFLAGGMSEISSRKKRELYHRHCTFSYSLHAIWYHADRSSSLV